MNTPVSYFGGKMKLAKWIISHFPPHKRYIEVFGGGAAVLFAKDPSPFELYNDLDHNLFNFFQVLSNPMFYKDFERIIFLTPYSRELYYKARGKLKSISVTEALAFLGFEKVQRAVDFFITVRQCMSGDINGGWKFTKDIRNNCAGGVGRWLSAVNRLPEAAERLIRVQIENQHFRKLIPNYDDPETLFYLDPPYTNSERKSGGYKCEMTEEDHEELIEILHCIQGTAVLSGYSNKTYKSLETDGWKLKTKKTICSAAVRSRKSKLQGKGSGRRQSRVECLWIKDW